MKRVAFYSEGFGGCPCAPYDPGGHDLVSSPSLSVNQSLATLASGIPLPAAVGPASVIDQDVLGAGRPPVASLGATGGAGPADRLADFGATIAFTGHRAVLCALGQVDLVSAPELAAVLHAVIDRGHADVVLDLAGTDFMGAAGLGVIATTANRLRSAGGGLTIRSPSALVGLMLDATGLTQLVSLKPVGTVDHLGPEQTAAVPGSPVAIEAAGRAEQWRRVTAIPADLDVVDGALRLVVALAQATVSGADGVSVSLQRHGRLTTVAASDQTISDMDADQYATGEGPCVDASVEGRWFHAESLDQETRWPSFTPRARRLGISAILSNPLVTDDRPVGALNIYSRTAVAFAPREQELASVFATEASLILSHAGLDVSDEQGSLRLEEALRSRQVIAQAQCVVMERDGVSEDAAFALLRDFSRRSNRPLRERAADVVGSTRREAPWLED